MSHACVFHRVVQQRGGEKIGIVFAKLDQDQHHADGMDDVRDVGGFAFLIAVSNGGEGKGRVY
jgi:hypothetical protein